MRRCSRSTSHPFDRLAPSLRGVTDIPVDFSQAASARGRAGEDLRHAHVPSTPHGRADGQRRAVRARGRRGSAEGGRVGKEGGRTWGTRWWGGEKKKTK